MTEHVVAIIDELKPGQRKIIKVGGRSIGIFNVAGEFLAVRNRCPHQGGPLCEGLQFSALTSRGPGTYDRSRPGELIRCPWHGWEFDLRTGQSWFDPQHTRVRSYDVTVHLATKRRDQTEVETYDVNLDGDRVVITI